MTKQPQVQIDPSIALNKSKANWHATSVTWTNRVFRLKCYECVQQLW